MRVAAAWATLVILTAAVPAWATNVSGRIVVTEAFNDTLAKKERETLKADKACYWNEPNGIVAVRPLRIDPSRDLAVVFFRDGAKAPEPDALSSIKVHAGAMERNVIVTRPGSTIRFRNQDPFDHELYSPDLPAFQAERQSSGAFRPIEFAKEGIYSVRCKIMPHFTGHVVSTTATLTSTPKRDGTFSVPNIPPGKYTVKVFYNGAWIHSSSFAIAERQGREFKLELKLESTGSTDAPPEKPEAK